MTSFITRVIPKIKLNNGIEMPMIGLGTFHGNVPDLEEVEKAVTTALGVGYRHFDCAYNYQNEHGVGRALRKALDEKLVRRDQLFITSKLWLTFTRKDRVKEGLRRSLKALKIDYLDLFLIHWPMSLKQDDNDHFPVNPDGKIAMDETIDYLETWQSMEKCLEEGLVRAIGVSNFNLEQLTRLLKNCQVPPAVHQIESHPYLPQQQLIEFCQSRNIQVTAYSPLGNPSMQSKMFKRPGQGRLITEPIVSQLAKKHNKSVAQILIRYQVNRKVAVIPRSVVEKEMSENLQVFDFELDQDDMSLLDGLSCGWRSFPFEYLGIENHKNYPFNKEPF